MPHQELREADGYVSESTGIAKKAPNTAEITNEEDKFYRRLSRSLRERSARTGQALVSYEEVPENVRQLILNSFAPANHRHYDAI